MEYASRTRRMLNANNLRKEHGASYIIEGLYQMAREDSNAVLESVRTIGEAEFLKKQTRYIFVPSL
jgi:hypothetical protein